MNKPVIATIMIVMVLTLAWLVWFRPAQVDEEPSPIVTEVPVETARVVRATLHAYITAYGSVEAEPDAGSDIGAFTPGVVSRVNCAVGQQVERGEELFQLDSRTADVMVAAARQVLERQEKLMQVEGTSEKNLQEAEQKLAEAMAQRSALSIASPLAGIVTRVNVRPGEAVDAATVLAQVLDPRRLVANVNVPSTELGAVQVGQDAEVRVNASANPVRATVSFVSPQVDAINGTAPVRAALPAKSGLRAGEFLSMQIVSETHKDCLAVPLEAVVKDAGGTTVIALVENGQSRQIPVETGLSDGQLIEVKAAGLEEGMTVVTEGAYALPEQTKIRVTGQ
jgi:membrane fusion protein (multidrug efflux system)